MADPQNDPNDEPFEEQFALPKKNRDETEMDITPMIDITFLLLIFFLVASKMDQSAEVSLPPARTGGAVGNKESIIILVKKVDEDSVEVRGVHDNQFSDDLEQQEKDIVNYVVKGLRGESPFANVKSQVMIKAEKGVKHGEVARVAKAVGRGAKEQDASLPSLHIAVLEIQ